MGKDDLDYGTWKRRPATRTRYAERDARNRNAKKAKKDKLSQEVEVDKHGRVKPKPGNLF